MSRFAVTVHRNRWYRTDYVLTMLATSAIAALSIAGKTARYRQVSKGKVLRVSATRLPDDFLSDLKPLPDTRRQQIAG